MIGNKSAPHLVGLTERPYQRAALIVDPIPWCYAPETDYKIRQLAKLWGTTIVEAWARCCHYAGARFNNPIDPQLFTDTAAIRQAEAKVEMLKADL
jgi:hypothetical protein